MTDRTSFSPREAATRPAHIRRSWSSRVPGRPLGAEAGRSASTIVGRALVCLTLVAGSVSTVSAQSVEDTRRLAGVDRIAVRVDASWDELITMEAGGATEDQFVQALEMTFGRTMTESDAAPSVDETSPYTVACHVDTFYETGLIIYSFRAQLERTGEDGLPVVVWLRSWVGSFTTQQLHLAFTLGEQCARSFLEEWKSAN